MRLDAAWCRAPFYPTDLSDEQRAVLEPLLPVMLCGTPLGGQRGFQVLPRSWAVERTHAWTTRRLATSPAR